MPPSAPRTLVATVLSNSIRHNNLDVIETGYDISLWPLSVFANEVYKNCDTHCFKVMLSSGDADTYTEKDKLLVIDGGFSRAYQKPSGIAGYTLLIATHNQSTIHFILHSTGTGRCSDEQRPVSIFTHMRLRKRFPYFGTLRRFCPKNGD